jgi:hypothetical protein
VVLGRYQSVNFCCSEAFAAHILVQIVEKKAVTMRDKVRRMIGKFLKAILSLSDQLMHFWMKTARRIVLFRQRVLYRDRPSDVFIVSYPKSGTTWMQMILYQLFTDGEMSIPHISAVIPHLEEDIRVVHNGLEHLSSPRILKTHLKYSEVPKGCGRYIYVMRDGLDVAVSFYYHYRRARGFIGNFDYFFDLFMKGEVAYGSWFSHLDQWISNPRRLKILIVKYEDLTRNFVGTVTRVAQFCDQPLDEAKLARILDNSSFEAMRKQESKFDNMTRDMDKVNEEDNHFIRKGQVGGWRTHVGQELQRIYCTAIDLQLKGSIFDEYRHPA